MSELNDFLKVLSEGKKQKQEKVVEAHKSLGDFLSAVASEKAIQNKLKFLEQAIGKIAATSPGSGEVNLR